VIDDQFPDDLTIHVSACSNIYYINDKYDKRTWTYIFGACCATTVFIPSFHNYRIWSFIGLLMTTYTAWYLTIAAIAHGQVSKFFYVWRRGRSLISSHQLKLRCFLTKPRLMFRHRPMTL